MRALQAIRRSLALNEISGEIVDASMKVHSALGPGLLESAYHPCVAHELRKRSLHVDTQVPVPVRYDGVIIRAGYRIRLGLLINLHELHLRDGIIRLANRL